MSNDLTYEKLLDVYNKYKKEYINSKFDSNLFCPFAEENNHTYYVSIACYDLLFEQFSNEVKENNLYFYNLNSPFDFHKFLGIELVKDYRIPNNDYGLYYQDRHNKTIFHPVLYWKGFKEECLPMKSLENS